MAIRQKNQLTLWIIARERRAKRKTNWIQPRSKDFLLDHFLFHLSVFGVCKMLLFLTNFHRDICWLHIHTSAIYPFNYSRRSIGARALSSNQTSSCLSRRREAAIPNTQNWKKPNERVYVIWVKFTCYSLYRIIPRKNKFFVRSCANTLVDLKISVKNGKMKMKKKSKRKYMKSAIHTFIFCFRTLFLIYFVTSDFDRFAIYVYVRLAVLLLLLSYEVSGLFKNIFHFIFIIFVAQFNFKISLFFRSMTKTKY